MSMSRFQRTSLRFRNAAMAKVRVVSVDAPAIRPALEACRSLFELLDRGDPYQAALTRQVWELRAHVLFTLLPFDSPEMALLPKLEGISKAAASIPGVRSEATRLDEALRLLFAQPKNPKYQWIVDQPPATSDGSQSDGTAVLAMMAMGRTFGCPVTSDNRLIAPWPVHLIDSRRTIAEGLFDKVIIPGTCHYLSPLLFTELFHEGRARTVDVLVYPGERFSLRKRLSPPESSTFRGRLMSRPIICSMETTTPPETDARDTDAWMKEGLWHLTHQGEQSPGPGLISARYILFRDGRGMFVPSAAYFLVWRNDAATEGRQLESVTVDRLAEGDWLAMQPTDTGYLLDIESAAAGFGQKMEDACDWRPALERLLLTASPEEIAEEMRAEGARGVSLEQSLRNWAEGTVYGPGYQSELRALLAVLIEHGKLSASSDFDQYVAEHWKGLRDIRGIRHRAGHHVLSRIHSQLSNALEQLEIPGITGDIFLEGDVRIQLSQVAALDEQTNWIPASRLMHLQPMRGGRWHE